MESLVAMDIDLKTNKQKKTQCVFMQYFTLLHWKYVAMGDVMFLNCCLIIIAYKDAVK